MDPINSKTPTLSPTPINNGGFPAEESQRAFTSSPSASGNTGMLGGQAMDTSTLVTPPNKKSKLSKTIIPAVIGIVVLIAGVVAGLYLIKQRQELSGTASIPGGEARVRIEPTSSTISAGQTLPVKIWFNTGGHPVSGVTVQLNYATSGSTPFLEVKGIDISQDLLNMADWSFPTKRATISGNNVQIKIAGNNTSTIGYTSTGESLLATINFQGQASGSTTVSFDAEQSKITDKSTAQDILLIPSSTASFVVQGAATGATSTPIPTSTPTSTPVNYYGATPTPTRTPTPTPTPTPTSTATPATTSAIPVTGASLPTILILGMGILAVGVSLLLVF